MKKLMTALTICAVAGFAIAADVVSENVVGFANKNAVATGWTLLGCNWEKVGGGDITLGALIGADTELLDGDMMQIYDPFGPAVTYTYASPDWLDESYAVANPVLTVGSAIWFFHDGPAMTFTMSGQVKLTQVVTTLPANTWSQFSANVAVSFNPNDTAALTWATVEDGSFIQQYLTPDSSVTYTYASPDWLDPAYSVVADPIAAIGEGLWFFNASPTTAATLTQLPPVL